MLDFGNFKARDCGNGLGRRSFLKTASALPFAFGAGYGGIDLEAARKLGDRAKAKSDCRPGRHENTSPKHGDCGGAKFIKAYLMFGD